MKPFSLDNVLNHRQRLEDLAQSKFNEAKEIVETIHNRHQEAQSKLQALLEEVERVQRQGIEITMLIRYQDQVKQQEEHLAAIKKNLRDKENLVQQTQQNLLAKTRDRQIMEQLKEEQNKTWRKYLEKKESMMLDEIATMRHGTEL